MPTPRAGELSDWIRVDRAAATAPGETGQPGTTWAPVFEGWARVEAVSGSLALKAEQVQSRVRYLVTVPEPIDAVELQDRVATETPEGPLQLRVEFVRREPRRRFVELFCSREDARAP